MVMSKSAVANRATGSETIVTERAGDEGTGLLYSMVDVLELDTLLCTGLLICLVVVLDRGGCVTGGIFEVGWLCRVRVACRCE